MQNTAQTSEAFQAARKHTVFVRLMRRGLPILAGCGALAFLALSFWPRAMGPLPKLDTSTVSLDGTRITMQTPVLKGFGRESRPYELRAQAAEQDLKTPNLVELKGLDATIGMADGGNALVQAGRGRYDSANQRLELQDNVRVNAKTQGYDAQFIEATMDFKSNTVVSERPVSVRFEDGEVHASAMSIMDNGAKVLFKGRVRMTLVPKPGVEGGAEKTVQ